MSPNRSWMGRNEGWDSAHNGFISLEYRAVFVHTSQQWFD